MSYCKTKEREKARYDAVYEVLREGRRPAEVARRFGVYRSTIKRWVDTFLELQEAREITWKSCRIPTKSARPKVSPRRISHDLTFAIIETRLAINRCAEVVHRELLNQGYQTSLSTVRRTIRRSGLVKEKSKWFQDQIVAYGMTYRHTRVRRPNDNAHIERFNRTLREECTSNCFVRSVSLTTLNQRIGKYLDYYNHQRIHLGISYRTPSGMLQRC